MMDQFDLLVQKQVEVMEKLLILQSEIEKLQHIENELKQDDKNGQLTLIRAEIFEKKKLLKEIHKQFDFLTEELINHFQHSEQKSQLAAP